MHVHVHVRPAEPSDEPQARRDFKRHHRNVRKHWQLPGDFPSARVVEAYLQPRLDPNTNKFAFGRPDLQLLHQFCA